jgi:hypothetical protein
VATASQASIGRRKFVSRADGIEMTLWHRHMGTGRAVNGFPDAADCRRAPGGSTGDEQE